MRLAILAFVVAAACRLAGGAAEGEPHAEGKRIPLKLYGDAENIRLLAVLLDDKDAATRERAAGDLGETHNPLALDRLRRALADPQANVRAAAVAAAVELDVKGADKLIGGALADKNSTVVITAMQCVRRMRLAGLGGKIRKLLARDDARVRSAALYTLTELKLPAAADELKRALGSDSITVRLRAAENAALAKGAASLAPTLEKLAAADTPAVRGAALAAIGKLRIGWRPTSSQINNPHPLIRRGAVTALGNAGAKAAIRPFLDDDSPAVRLAAIRAAGQTKAENCTAALLELLDEVSDNTAHLAARDSLVAIGGETVSAGAAKLLGRTAGHIDTVQKQIDELKRAPKSKAKAKARMRVLVRRRGRLYRNASACCRILGHLRSRAALKTQFQMLRSLPTDAPPLADLAESLAQIGDCSAAKPITAALIRCGGLAQAYLAAFAAAAPLPPFDEQITGRLIVALGDLKAAEATGAILRVARTRFNILRLNTVAAYTSRAAGKLITDKNRADIETFLLDVLNDTMYLRIAHFEAAKAAGRLKLAKAVMPLNKLLNEQPRVELLMKGVAWSIGQITGQTPDMPAPTVQQGNWIIRKSGKSERRH